MDNKKLIFILILVTVLAYFSSLGSPFIWDDEQFIQRNVFVQNFDVVKIFTTSTTEGAGVQSNYYRPLTTLSFAIDRKIWGQNPLGFHLTNLFIHIAAGLVLFSLLEALGLPSIVSFFISLFFLIHPIQTEAVTYINSRGDSLYTFFLFLSLYLFVRKKAKRKLLLATGIIGAFICSLFSKEIALAGGGLFFLLFLFQNRQELPWRFIKQQRVSLFVIGSIMLVTLFYFVLRLSVLNFGNTLNFYGIQSDYSRYISIRLYTFCKVVWMYLGLLVFPYPLHMERSVSLVRSFLDPWVLSLLGLIALVFWLGWQQLKKNNPWVLFATLWFFIMLIPSSGIVPINGILYEHWLYVPMVGFFIALYGVIKFLMNFKKVMAKFLIPFGIVIAILYIFLTVRQNNIWADPITFYTYTLSFAPQSARLHNNLGMTLADAGRGKEAILEYEKALSFVSSYPQPYNNLGNIFVSLGNFPKAEEEYQKALQLSPDFTTAKVNLLDLYLKWGKYEKSISLFVSLESLYISDPRFQFNYGLALWRLGRKTEAKEKFQQALLSSNNNYKLKQIIDGILLRN